MKVEDRLMKYLENKKKKQAKLVLEKENEYKSTYRSRSKSPIKSYRSVSRKSKVSRKGKKSPRFAMHSPNMKSNRAFELRCRSNNKSANFKNSAISSKSGVSKFGQYGKYGKSSKAKEMIRELDMSQSTVSRFDGRIDGESLNVSIDQFGSKNLKNFESRTDQFESKIEV